ncbi:MAG TPA: carbon-nitrogen hydrolase family protein [archaeon]|nr:carbon-nitrogen hydrolase family protein [archaeon]
MNSLTRLVLRKSLAAVAFLLFASLNLSAMDNEVVISVYQGPSQNGDFSANLETVRREVNEALKRGSDFVVFPETFLSGYDTPELVRQGARKEDDPELTAFIRESSGHEMVILVGLARITAEGLYNSILVIHQGRLLGTYDKIMLTEGDRDELGFLPGKELTVFSAHGTRFAVIICHDSSFPHLAMMAKLKGAEILFTPHYNSIGPQTVDDHRKWVRNCHVGLACQMKMVVARSNVVVTAKKDDVGYGDSFIMSPQGEILAGAELFKTEMVTATITPDMFRSPYVWADLKEVPQWVKKELAGLLVKGEGN